MICLLLVEMLVRTRGGGIAITNQVCTKGFHKGVTKKGMYKINKPSIMNKQYYSYIFFLSI